MWFLKMLLQRIQSKEHTTGSWWRKDVFNVVIETLAKMSPVLCRNQN
jgi:hypothetical protein